MFRRRTEGKVTRKTEAERARKHLPKELTDIKGIIGAKLGIHREGRNVDKIRYELNRNKHNLEALGITSDMLKEFNDLY